MPLNLANFAPMLKTLYSKKRVENLTFPESNLFMDVPKAEDFYGQSFTQPLIYGNPQGRSQQFTVAQANKGNTQSAKFVVTRTKDYGLVSIDNETILASQNDAGAFAAARKTEIDGMFREMAATAGIDLVGTGSGVRGQVSVAQVLSASVLALLDPADIVKFEVGQAIVASAANGGGAVRSGVAYIVARDYRNGTVTVSSSMGGAPTALNTCISAIAVSDFLFVQGDYDAKLKGYKAWLAYGGPSATPFFGLDRTVDQQRLAGVWEDLSALSIEEALIEGAKIMKRVGANIDRVWISDDRMADLIKSQGTKVQFVNNQVTPELGFQGVKLQTGKGVVDVFADRNLSAGDALMLQRDTWVLKTLGGMPQILNMDSLEALRDATSDSIEVRIGYYGQLICSAPGRNGIFKI